MASQGDVLTPEQRAEAVFAALDTPWNDVGSADNKDDERDIAKIAAVIREARGAALDEAAKVVGALAAQSLSVARIKAIREAVEAIEALK